MSEGPKPPPEHDQPDRPSPPAPGRESPGCDAAVCPICGGPLVGVHCKLLCENCGYREDCSDLFAD